MYSATLGVYVNRYASMLTSIHVSLFLYIYIYVCIFINKEIYIIYVAKQLPQIIDKFKKANTYRQHVEVLPLYDVANPILRIWAFHPARHHHGIARLHCHGDFRLD